MADLGKTTLIVVMYMILQKSEDFNAEKRETVLPNCEELLDEIG
jgi:hypothetical protein